MQVRCPRKPLEIVVIVAHGCACLQPLRLLLRTPGRKVDLDEFYRAGHQGIRCESLLYDARAAPGWVAHRGNFEPPDIASKLQAHGRKDTHNHPVAIVLACSAGTMGAAGRLGHARRGALLSFRFSAHSRLFRFGSSWDLDSL
jgi:hypothetical protein